MSISVAMTETAWQVVRQSWLIHPDRDAEMHLGHLDDAGYDLGSVFNTGDAPPLSTPAQVVSRWVEANREGRGPRGLGS